MAAWGNETRVMLPALTNAAITTQMKIFWAGPAASNQNKGGISHIEARTVISTQMVPVLGGTARHIRHRGAGGRPGCRA